MDEELKNTEPVEETSDTQSTGSTTEANTTLSNEDKINQMYDANITSKRAGLENQMNQALSNAKANKDNIANTFNQQKNSIAAEYERQKRNNNLQADRNGLNTGAASQMSLGQMNAYQNQQGALGKEQGKQEAEADRNMETIRQNYQTQITQAEADNDFEKMRALYEEGIRAEQQARDDAAVQASFGDFSGYIGIYGQAGADLMQKSWALQNPDLAYNLGYLSADEYKGMTGTYPQGYGAPSYGGGGYYGGGHDTSGNTGNAGDTSGKTTGTSVRLEDGQKHEVSGKNVSGANGSSSSSNSGSAVELVSGAAPKATSSSSSSNSNIINNGGNNTAKYGNQSTPGTMQSLNSYLTPVSAGGNGGGITGYIADMFRTSYTSKK